MNNKKASMKQLGAFYALSIKKYGVKPNADNFAKFAACDRDTASAIIGGLMAAPSSTPVEAVAPTAQCGACGDVADHDVRECVHGLDGHSTREYNECWCASTKA